MADFSTLNALSTLCSSVPLWSTRLDNLNGQIALRQIELARITENNERQPTRSLKNKGSTESLRPREDRSASPFYNEDNVTAGPNPFATPVLQQNGSLQRPSSSAAVQAAAVVTPPPPKPNLNLQPSPSALNRQSSQPTPPIQGRLGLRKRKTDSLASAESNVPKYRTRSMIIVYYDSAVQIAFEELVKFVSASRNSMRKSKMTMKMAQMRRAAELEADKDDEEDGLAASENLFRAQKNVSVGNHGQRVGTGIMEADDDDVVMPQLKFVSTRQMGPSRDITANRIGGKLSVAMLHGYGRQRAGATEEKNIFDDIEKGLEWCQGQCERAAHQFLRDGECSEEIEAIKRKLAEVKDISGKELERLEEEEKRLAAQEPRPAPVTPKKTKARELRLPQMRKENLGNLKDFQVDDMEVDVDDEGVDGLDVPAMVYKRSRDIAL